MMNKKTKLFGGIGAKNGRRACLRFFRQCGVRSGICQIDAGGYSGDWPAVNWAIPAVMYVR